MNPHFRVIRELVFQGIQCFEHNFITGFLISFYEVYPISRLLFKRRHLVKNVLINRDNTLWNYSILNNCLNNIFIHKLQNSFNLKKLLSLKYIEPLGLARLYLLCVVFRMLPTNRIQSPPVSAEEQRSLLYYRKNCCLTHNNNQFLWILHS